MYRYHLIQCLLVLLASCSTTGTPPTAPVSTGFVVQVNQAFDNLSNASRISFQHGARVAARNLDRWTTYCRLYVYNRLQNADYVTRVSPGDFEISRVTIGYRSSDSYPPGISLPVRPSSTRVDPGLLTLV